MTSRPALQIGLLHPYHWDDVARGGERYLHDLAYWLANDGHRVDVVTGTPGPAVTEDDGGVTVHRVHYRVPSRLARRGVTDDELFAIAALPTLRRRRYDVVHALTPAALLAARLCRHPSLYTALGHPGLGRWEARSARRAVVRQAIRRANVAVAFSDATAQRLETLFGRECITLPIGVELTEFAPDLDARSGPPRLLFAGYPAEPRKGAAVALAAMPRILDVHPDARLVFPGRAEFHRAYHDQLGRERERVLAAVDDIGVAPMSDMPAQYRAATVSVLPSREESLGIALVESLACGTPIVCSDDGGMVSIASDPTVSRRSRTGDADDLARAVLEAIEVAHDASTPKRCVAHASSWSWDVVGPRHVAAYRDVCLA